MTEREAREGRVPNKNGRPPPYAPPGFYGRLLAALIRVAGGGAPGWQAEAARRLGVGRGTVCMWANGVQPPGVANLVEIARLAGVSLHHLLVGEGPVEAPGTQEACPAVARVVSPPRVRWGVPIGDASDGGQP